MDTCLIPLTQGLYALIDAEDYPRIGGQKWYAHPDGATFYARRNDRSGGRHRTVQMHRFILDAPDGIEVDHVNGNGLDNRRSNLRLATHAENARNCRAKGAAGYHGITFIASRGYYHVYVTLAGKRTYLGIRRTADEATALYDAAVKSSGDPFLPLNFCEVPE